MDKKQPIIAIDGYSSTGKSSYAKMLAQDFKWKNIDTGAMYRAITYYALKNCYKDGSVDIKKLISELPSLTVDFHWNNHRKANDTYLNGKNIEKEIRNLEVSKHVSEIAKEPAIRNFLVEKQREIGKNGGVVMDGRDIGTIVFPQATVKFFITASLDERAKRRFLEYQAENNSKITLKEVKENLEKRDFIDENRAVSPLKKANDAFLIDNTYESKEETYQKIKKIIKEKIRI